MGIRSSAPVKPNNLKERLKNNQHHHHHHHRHHDLNDPFTSTDGQIPSSSTTPQLRKYKNLTTNPFIIFYLRLKSKKPRQHVTVIAKIAGKLWTKMTPEQRKKYIDIAEAEKKRRDKKKRKKRKKNYISSSLKTFKK